MPVKDCALVFRFRSSGSGRFRGRLGVRSRRGGFCSVGLRVLVVVLGLSAVSSLVTGFTAINTKIVVHLALLLSFSVLSVHAEVFRDVIRGRRRLTGRMSGG